jgi:hypothetical protein
LIELALAMAVFLVALSLATQILMETAQLFAETSGEALDTPVPLVLARIRADVQGAVSVFPIEDADGELATLAIQGFGGQILYQKQDEALYRTVVPASGPPKKPTLLWRDVTDWKCEMLGPNLNLVNLEVTYRRRTVPRTPLPRLPAFRGPLKQELTQRMYLLPRGAGLAGSW